MHLREVVGHALLRYSILSSINALMRLFLKESHTPRALHSSHIDKARKGGRGDRGAFLLRVNSYCTLPPILGPGSLDRVIATAQSSKNPK